MKEITFVTRCAFERSKKGMKLKMKSISKKVKPGLAAKNVQRMVNIIEKEKHKTVNQDTENRMYVIQKMREFIQEGYSLEDAANLMMKDDIMKQFDYWTKNNLDVKQCIINLVKSHIPQKAAA